MEILLNLTPNQIWKLQDISKKSIYEIGSTVILFHCPKNKSTFKNNKYDNPRYVGSRWKVISRSGDSLLVESLELKRPPRYTIHKKYLMDLSIWRDVQLDFLLN